MRKIFFLVLTLAITTGVCAQQTTADEETTEQTFSHELAVDLLNQYIWRGMYDGAVSIQPTVGVEYHGLSLTAWGNVGLNGKSKGEKDYTEIDLTLGYTTGGLSVGVTDYWFNEGNYFRFGGEETTHVFEGYIGYDLDFIAAKWYTNFYGNDKDEDGDRTYSSYLELSAPFRLASLEWEATAGFVPFKSDYYNTDGFACTSIILQATKRLSLGKQFTLPIFAALHFNPDAEKAYMVCGVNISL